MTDDLPRLEVQCRAADKSVYGILRSQVCNSGMLGFTPNVVAFAFPRCRLTTPPYRKLEMRVR
jgi:hypothetical protein